MKFEIHPLFTWFIQKFQKAHSENLFICMCSLVHNSGDFFNLVTSEISITIKNATPDKFIPGKCDIDGSSTGGVLKDFTIFT